MQCLLAGKVPMSEYFAIDYTPHDITPYSKFFVSKFLKTITTNTGRNVAPEGDIPRQQGDQGSMTRWSDGSDDGDSAERVQELNSVGQSVGQSRSSMTLVLRRSVHGNSAEETLIWHYAVEYTPWTGNFKIARSSFGLVR